MDIRKIIGLSAICLATLGLGACDINEGPAEEAGEEIDQAIDKVEDKAEEAKEELQN